MEIRDPAEFARYFERIHQRTWRVIGCIPPERFDWAPAEGAFSFADLLRHLAALERYMFAENVQGRPSRYPGHSRELAASPEEVLALWRRLHGETLEVLRGLAPEDLGRRCETPGGASLPVWKWLRAMVEHHVHHRGQLYLMLRLIDVPTPPLYGLTSEEVLERSGP